MGHLNQDALQKIIFKNMILGLYPTSQIFHYVNIVWFVNNIKLHYQRSKLSQP